MAEDIARPLCKCHGEPMLKDGWERGKQKWQCGVVERKRQRTLYSDPEFRLLKLNGERRRWRSGNNAKAKALYYKRKALGLCIKCGEPSLSEALCWDHLNYLEEQHALRI